MDCHLLAQTITEQMQINYQLNICEQGCWNPNEDSIPSRNYTFETGTV